MIARVISVAVAVIAASLMVVSTGHAAEPAEFGYVPCTDAPDATYDWAVVNPGTFFELNAPCRGEWSLRVGLGAWLNVQGRAELVLPGDELTSIDLWVTGKDRTSEDVPQYFVVCRGGSYPEDCGLPVTGSTSWGNIRQALTLNHESGFIPSGADRIMLVSACTSPDPSLDMEDVIDPETAEICFPSADDPRFTVRYVSALDSDDPVMSPVGLSEDRWINSIANRRVQVSDQTSGVNKVVLQPRLQTHREVGVCDSSSGCPRFAEVLLPFDRPYPGRNTYTLTTYDEARHSVSESFTIKFDDREPLPPLDLSVGAKNGWVVGATAVARWTNYKENLPSSISSGVAKARLDLTEEGGVSAPGFPKEVSGVGIEAAVIDIPFPSSWTLDVELVDAAGNVGGASSLRFHNELAGPGIPQFWRIAPINLASAGSGAQIRWQTGLPSRSGVCGFRGWIGMGEPPDLTRDPTTTLPVSTDRVWNLSPSGLLNLKDGVNTVALATVDCAGEVSPVQLADVVVDRRPPRVALSPNSRWIDAGIELNVIGSEDGDGADGSGVKSVWYRVDAEAVQEATGAEATIGQLSPGLHTIRFGSTDRAGNKSQEGVRVVGFDQSAPALSIEGVDGSLNEFRSVAIDPLSGVVSVEQALVGPDGGRQPIGDSFHSNSGSVTPVTLSTALPEDLAEGDYQLRTVAFDEAGNSQTVVRSIRLPLRRQVRLTAGIARAEAPNAIRNEITTRLGGRALLRGALVEQGGQPIAGANLNVLAVRDGDGGRRRLATVTTASDGSYRLRLGTDVSRRIEVMFGGDGQRLASIASVRENVRASVSLSALDATVRRGDKLVLHGRVRLLSASTPRRGVPIGLDFCTRHRCAGYRIPVTTDSDGGYLKEVSTIDLRRGIYRLRARVDTLPAGWPFADGQSRKIVVRIR